MGVFSAAVFGDDFALDVRDEYLAMIAEGTSDREANRKIVESFNDSIRDSDDGPVFWLALAATQWDYGRFDPRVKARALTSITQSKKDGRWAGSPLEQKRLSVLERLAQRLHSTPPTRRAPRRRQVRETPKLSAIAPDQNAYAEAWTTGPSKNCPEPFSQVCVIMKSKRQQGGGGVFAAYCELSSLKLKWVDHNTIQISYPKLARLVSQKKSTYFYGRTIAIKYRRITVRSGGTP
jgi:hypothetical protein